MVTVALRLPALGSLSVSVSVPVPVPVPLAVVTVGGFRRLRLPVGVLAGSPIANRKRCGVGGARH